MAKPGDDGWIEVRGARTHNLQDIEVKLPRGQFVVISGVSGSGKSSLAFDTLYAEGQRRYVESLSSYARQFIGQMKKADCDSIEGLSPAISIDQKQGSSVIELKDWLHAHGIISEGRKGSFSPTSKFNSFFKYYVSELDPDRHPEAPE